MIFLCAIVPMIMGCDLQPKIVSLPDTVGEFITARYPALLADPNTQPEIYNSAASDYGVYASPELYGSVGADDYVMYASVDDYIVPPQAGADDVSAAALYGEPVIADNTATPAPDDVAGADVSNVEIATDDYLNVPEYHAPDVANAAAVAPATENAAAQPNTTTRVKLREITVAVGDTLYSLSRKYSVPVNDLAVMNNISAPFALSVGQKLKVPDLASAPVRAAATTPAAKTAPVATTAQSKYGTPPTAPKVGVAPKVATPTVAATKANPSTTTKSGAKNASQANAKTQPVKHAQQKISSDPNKKLPSIAARSSSKFSWPVRGKILSHYGAKSGGLFNDGINIGASRGTAVKAAENGVVAYAGNEVKGMGNLVIIQHSGGWMTVYAHMGSMSVRRGARVSVGQKIGTVGATGKVDQPQLHFEIRKGTKAYNPSSYLRQ